MLIPTYDLFAIYCKDFARKGQMFQIAFESLTVRSASGNHIQLCYCQIITFILKKLNCISILYSPIMHPDHEGFGVKYLNGIFLQKKCLHMKHLRSERDTQQTLATLHYVKKNTLCYVLICFKLPGSFTT